jgi:hypothetical protein
MSAKQVHTVPNPDQDSSLPWANEVNGEVVSRHHLKTTAVKQGRQDAIAIQAEHFIHNRDGKIGEKNSYGHDPRNVKG